MCNIPVRASKRGEEYPIIMMGGPCAYNPEPLYDIADVFILGEGEEVTHDVLDVYKEMKGKSKAEYLRAISKIQGVYVPSIYDVNYNEDGTIKDMTPKYEDVPKTVKKRIVPDFNANNSPEKFIVPYTEIIHDRIVIETFRGCTRGCRFCQAGMIYRPVREKTTEKLMEEIDILVKNTGYQEISLSSLSICDYSNIQNLIFSLIEKYGEEKIGVSIPSIRIDAFSVDLIKEIQKVRKTGLTFAPEAGTQRMRDVINKGVTEEDLLRSARNAFESGWSTIKLYFVIGLPYETVEDVEGIAHLAEKVVEEYFHVPRDVRKRGLRVTVSTSILVPKPFTPFQWAPMNQVAEVREKISSLRDAIKSKAINYNWHESALSYLEAVFARGDRKLCDVLVKAFEKGARFDGWNEYFNFELWQEAFEECGVDGDFYAYRERSYDEILPWDFIDIGVSKSYLISENEKAKEMVLTPDCRERCTGCGINTSFKERECFHGALFNKIH